MPTSFLNGRFDMGTAMKTSFYYKENTLIFSPPRCVRAPAFGSHHLVELVVGANLLPVLMGMVTLYRFRTASLSPDIVSRNEYHTDSGTDINSSSPSFTG